MLLRTSILKQPNKILYFEKVLKLQETYQQSLITGISKNQFVWIGEHNLCYTIGRGGDKKNLLPSLNTTTTKKIKYEIWVTFLFNFVHHPF